METKDLVLLMLMPIVLISLIVYVNKESSITGAAAVQQEKSTPDDVMGTYSIMPSFKADFDYDLEGEYTKINERLSSIIEICRNSGDISQCLKDKAGENNWNCLGTEDGIIEVFYEFVDKFNECANLEEEKAVCRFSLDGKETASLTKGFKIRLANENQRVKAEVVKDKVILAREYLNIENLLYTGYNNRDETGKNADYVEIVIGEQDKKPAVEKAYAVAGPDKIGLSKILLLYKIKNEVKFIDELEENLFRVEKIIDLPKRKGFKFCARTGKQAYAYDTSEDMAKIRDIVYRFAVTYQQSAPPKPIENLEAFDAVKAENSIVLAWDKSSEQNIKSYAIYYSAKDFADIKIDNIKKDQSISKKSAENTAVEIKNIDLKTCIFNPIGQPCKYLPYSQQLEKGALYYWQDKNKLVYLIADVKDGILYNFAVTAIGEEGVEINNDKSISGNTNILTLNKNYQKSTPIDDLAPNRVLSLQAQSSGQGKAKLSWKKPEKNVDGTASNDITGFDVYYKKSQQMPAMQDKIDASYIKKPLKAAEAGCDSPMQQYCEYVIDSLENKIYNFAVTATDKNSNEFTNNADVIGFAVT